MKGHLGAALIGQSGGPTAVINQSLVGVIESCLQDSRIERVLGAVHGIRGVLDGALVDLSLESRAQLERVARTPGAALRSVRKKPTEEEAEEIVRGLASSGVRLLFYIGGNDSAETALLLVRAAEGRSQDLTVIHVPKTVDNDLAETDHCPGYGSAARFVALAHLGDDLDCRSLPGIKINVVMGRHAGWLTAASALARHQADAGPHLICLPERAFEWDRFLGAVSDQMARHGRCIATVSEGIHDASGTLIANASDRDSHGNVQLSGSGSLGDLLSLRVRAALGKSQRVRADTFGYAQRSFPACISESDAVEARNAGRAAVRFALEQPGRSGSVVLRREPGPEYRVRYELAPLEALAQQTRVIPEEFLRGDHDVAPAFVEWLRPLVGPLEAPGLLGLFPVAKAARS